MNFNKAYIQKLHYDNEAKIPFLFKFLSFFYLIIISFKNFLYSIRILKEQKVNAYVICIGNLTTGGVGKTPIVCETANHLHKNGKKVTVLSRGYGGKLNNKNVNVIKNENELLINDAKLCGDEPYLIAQNTSGVPVLTCRDRIKSAKYAIDNFNSEFLVMDDGFSNRKIYKDLNIIVIDSKKRLGNEFLLPAGPLREPIKEIKRAQKIILVNKDDKHYHKAQGWSAQKFKNTPVITCTVEALGVYDIFTDDKIVFDNSLPQQYAIAFCAIGQPEQFFDYVKKFYNLIITKAYDDHYVYSDKDVQDIVSLAQNNNIKTIVTTRKDAVKIKNLVSGVNEVKIVVLEIKPKINIKELLNETESNI